MPTIDRSLTRALGRIGHASPSPRQLTRVLVAAALIGVATTGTGCDRLVDEVRSQIAPSVSDPGPPAPVSVSTGPRARVWLEDDATAEQAQQVHDAFIAATDTGFYLRLSVTDDAITLTLDARRDEVEASGSRPHLTRGIDFVSALVFEGRPVRLILRDEHGEYDVLESTGRFGVGTRMGDEGFLFAPADLPRERRDALVDGLTSVGHGSSEIRVFHVGDSNMVHACPLYVDAADASIETRMMLAFIMQSVDGIDAGAVCDGNGLPYF